jgi:hypothetical protein
LSREEIRIHPKIQGGKKNFFLTVPGESGRELGQARASAVGVGAIHDWVRVGSGEADAECSPNQETM